MVEDLKIQIKNKYGIQFLSENNLIIYTRKDDVLWTTRCSKTKQKKRGLPIELYDSYITRFFYQFVISRNLPFAIVSDKYGLHFFDEILPFYDIHPSIINPTQKKELGEMIKKKAISRGYLKIIFYNNSPMMSTPYFEILFNSGLEIFFTTKLLK